MNRTAFIGINRYKAQKQIFDYMWTSGYRRWFLLENYNQKRYNKLYSSTVTRNFWTVPANLKNWQDIGEAMGKQIIENYINDPGWAICSNDDKTTWAAIKYLTDHQIRVPDDFAFISWDGLIESDFIKVPLTTLIIPHQQMLQLAIDWFKSPDMGNQNITLDTQIRKGATLPLKEL